MTIKNLKVLLLILFLPLLLVSCAKDDATIIAFDQPLVVEIIAGPSEGGTILNNSRFTFEWRARGGGASVSFQIQLTGVDASPVSTNEISKTYNGQPSGSYTFTVTATGGGETVTASRTFNVGANAGPPQALITGARGSASSGGSGVTPAYAPGQSAKFRWSGTDQDKFGTITGYRWRIADSEAFTEYTLGTTAGFVVPAPRMEPYTFTLEAQDNDGAVSTTTISYEVKAATIVIVDDKPQASAVDEVGEDDFYATILEGFAFATWDVSVLGVPTTGDITPYEVAIVYSATNSTLWDDVGDDYPEAAVPLSEFIDGGGKLWAMGEGILEDIRFPAGPDNDHSNPPGITEFEFVYLHIDTSSSWSRAGSLSNLDLKFSFADNVLGDPDNFPRITIDVPDIGNADVDNIAAGPGAEIIYQGLGGLQDVIGDVALRFPTGGTATEVVFMTFPLFVTADVKSSLRNTTALAQEIMREMGQ